MIPLVEVFSKVKRLSVLLTLITGLALIQVSFATTTYSNVEDGSWQTCSRCGGAGGTGPATPHSVTHVSSPSLDGHAAHFWVGGSTPYSNAYWWKSLGGSSSTNFVYDVYFYAKNPGASQALEFDMNQMIGGKWYIFGTECVVAGSPHWNVYDPYHATWVSTSIGCSVPAYKWNHLTVEFQRVNGKTGFVSVTLNGVKHYFNRAYAPRGSSSYSSTVAFQMDENRNATDYDVWVDKLNVTRW